MGWVGVVSHRGQSMTGSRSVNDFTRSNDRLPVPIKPRYRGFHRYDLTTCIGCDMKTVSGVPDPKHVSTSYVERQNLNMRMSMRRFTRLTNGFSKKVENHGHAVALYFAYYNFVRVHQTLRVTPAMEAGLSDHVWSVDELVSLLPEPEAKKRGPYKKAISN